ncbi:hypothetical protein [Streptosporangium sp. KLBMP 9127]|nr:hypothetical protein [Streptosporangium sp. KLBMP 9127]
MSALTSSTRPRQSARSESSPGSQSGDVTQLFGQPLQAILDELPIFVIAKRADLGPSLLQVLTGATEIAQFGSGDARAYSWRLTRRM